MRPMKILFLSVALFGGLLWSPAMAQAPQNPAELARIEVRFSALEERLRAVQGRFEQLEYENRRLREQLDLFQQDAEIRFNALESSGRDTAAPAAEASPQPAEAEATPATPSDKQVLKMPGQSNGQFADPREHYNHAFSLLNKTQYDESGKSFEAFIAAYPKDPLIGNAYYWAGETYYVRQNFVQAADYFRRGFEALPEGPKAGDNLLKLAMSLAALERGTEACVVLKQVAAKFGANSTTLKKKAESERNRLGCK